MSENSQNWSAGLRAVGVALAHRENSQNWWYVVPKHKTAKLYFQLPDGVTPTEAARRILGLEKFMPGHRLYQAPAPPQLQRIGESGGIQIFVEAQR